MSMMLSMDRLLGFRVFLACFFLLYTTETTRSQTGTPVIAFALAYSDVEWNGDSLLSVHFTVELSLPVAETGAMNNDNSHWDGAHEKPFASDYLWSNTNSTGSTDTDSSCFEHLAVAWKKNHRWIVTLDEVEITAADDFRYRSHSNESTGAGAGTGTGESTSGSGGSVIEQETTIEASRIPWKRRHSGWNSTASAHFLIRHDHHGCDNDYYDHDETSHSLSLGNRNRNRQTRAVLVALWEEHDHNHRLLATRRLVHLHPQQSVTEIQLQAQRAHILAVHIDSCTDRLRSAPTATSNSNLEQQSKPVKHVFLSRGIPRICATMLGLVGFSFFVWMSATTTLSRRQVHNHRTYHAPAMTEPNVSSLPPPANMKDYRYNDDNINNDCSASIFSRDNEECTDTCDSDGEDKENLFQKSCRNDDDENCDCGDCAEESSSDDGDWSPPMIERQADFVLPTEHHQLLFLSPLAAVATRDRSPPVLLRPHFQSEMYDTATSSLGQSQQEETYGQNVNPSFATYMEYRATLMAQKENRAPRRSEVLPTSDFADANTPLDFNVNGPPAVFRSLSSQTLPELANLEADGSRHDGDVVLTCFEQAATGPQTQTLLPGEVVLLPPSNSHVRADTDPLFSGKQNTQKSATHVEQATPMKSHPLVCSDTHPSGTLDEADSTDAFAGDVATTSLAPLYATSLPLVTATPSLTDATGNTLCPRSSATIHEADVNLDESCPLQADAQSVETFKPIVCQNDGLVGLDAKISVALGAVHKKPTVYSVGAPAQLPVVLHENLLPIDAADRSSTVDNSVDDEIATSGGYDMCAKPSLHQFNGLDTLVQMNSSPVDLTEESRVRETENSTVTGLCIVDKRSLIDLPRNLYGATSPDFSYVSTLPPDSNCSDDEAAGESMSFSSAMGVRTSDVHTLLSPRLHNRSWNSRRPCQTDNQPAQQTRTAVPSPGNALAMSNPTKTIDVATATERVEETISFGVDSVRPYKQRRAKDFALAVVTSSAKCSPPLSILENSVIPAAYVYRKSNEVPTRVLTELNVGRSGLSGTNTNSISGVFSVVEHAFAAAVNSSDVDAIDFVEYIGTRLVPDEVIPEMVLSRSTLAAIESINESCWEYDGQETASIRPNVKRSRRQKSIGNASRNLDPHLVGRAKQLLLADSASVSTIGIETTSGKSSNSFHHSPAMTSNHLERFSKGGAYFRASKRKKLETESGREI